MTFKHLVLSPKKKQEISIPTEHHPTEIKALESIGKAREFLKNSDTLEKAIAVKNYASLEFAYDRVQHYSQAQEEANDLRLDAERKSGQFLSEMEKNPGTILLGGGTGAGGTVVEPPAKIPTLQDLGIDKKDSSFMQKLASIPETSYQKFKKDTKKRTKNAIIQVYKEMKVKLDRENPDQISIPKELRAPVIIHGDFRYSDQMDDSVDAIITDPPYVKENLDVWEPLGEFGRRVLKPGSILATYAGQAHLPLRVNALCKSLDYYWTICLKHSGNIGLIPHFAVQNQWKPIFVFQKPPFKCRPFNDLIEGDGEEKTQHEWGQNYKEAIKLIEMFTEKGDIILEPFAGGGSTVQACIETKRNCVAYEIDDHTFELLKKRFPEADFR